MRLRQGKALGDDGAVCTVLTLGPIAVRPDFQNRGIGGRLLARTAEIAKGLGYTAIFLTGDPALLFQMRVPARRAVWHPQRGNAMPAALQVLPLKESALTQGTV